MTCMRCGAAAEQYHFLCPPCASEHPRLAWPNGCMNVAPPEDEEAWVSEAGVVCEWCRTPSAKVAR